MIRVVAAILQWNQVLNDFTDEFLPLVSEHLRGHRVRQEDGPIGRDFQNSVRSRL
jgi:hypothetical protein